MPPATSTSASASTSVPPSATINVVPPALSHFVIFNPTIQLPKQSAATDTQDELKSESGTAAEAETDLGRRRKPEPEPQAQAQVEVQDKDEQDDLREAAQILFYTSREAGGVSRDKMLRQVGLAKGLMGFADMLVKHETRSKYWSIHGHRSRLLLFTPERDFFFYINISLAHKDDDKKDPVPSSQGLSDEMLIDVLMSGYEEFRLLYGPLHTHLPATPAFSSLLDRYFTRFAFQFESDYLSTSSTLASWIDGQPAPSLSAEAIASFQREMPVGSEVLIVGPEGPLHLSAGVDEADRALMKYLHKLVQASLPPSHMPAPTAISPRTTRASSDGRQMLGLNFGLADLGIGSSRRPPSQAHRQLDDGGRKTSWMTLGGWVPDIRRSSTPIATTPPPSGEARQSSESTRASGKARTATNHDSPQLGKGKATENGRSGSSSKWGFGLGGLGDAFGGVGTALGLAGPSSDTTTGSGSGSNVDDHLRMDSRPTRDKRVVTSEPELDTHSQSQSMTESPVDKTQPEAAMESSKGEDEIHVEEDSLSIAALVEAAEPDEELEWDRKWVWVRTKGVATGLDDEGADEEYVRRRLRWIIRDNTLIAIVIPVPTDESPSASTGLTEDVRTFPSTRTTLDLFSRISNSINPAAPQGAASSSLSTLTPPSSASTHGQQAAAHGDSYIAKLSKGVSVGKGEIDPASDAVLVDLRGRLRSDPFIEEIYAKTPASKFVVSKSLAADSTEDDDEKSESGGTQERKELYMVVGRKDASLTDADHAFRSLTRYHPEFGT
ncbi:hypothetical protein IAU59_006804 [Kwoniella sp. CBS 9459]